MKPASTRAASARSMRAKTFRCRAAPARPSLRLPTTPTPTRLDSRGYPPTDPAFEIWCVPRTSPLPRLRTIAYGVFICVAYQRVVPANAGTHTPRTLVSALEQRPFFIFEARGDDGVDGPLRHRDVPE